MYTPKVSIIMNCFNGEKYLREAIDSVYAQTYTDWEIIFWDNASTDNTPSIAQSYDDRLRYFRGEQTICLGAARNMALREARGQYIAFLDCDDRWLPRKLERQVPLFEDSDVGIVFSDAVVFNQNGDSYFFHKRVPYATGKCFRRLLSEYFLCMQTVVLRRRALDMEGEWFDPRFEIGEEADLFIRIAHRWKLAMAEEPLAGYRLHSESSTWTKGYLVAAECELLLEKLANKIPDFWTRYGSEAERLRISSQLRKGSYYLRMGDLKSVRHCTFPYILRSRRAFMMFVASLLPESILLYFLRFLLKGKVIADKI